MTSEMSVRKFTDYRAFLVAHAQDMKKSKPDWSYGSWAKRLGLKTTSSITKILDGDREAGEQISEQMVRYFNFKEKDAQYFRDLISLSKLRKNPRLGVLLLEKMSKEHPNGMQRLLDSKTFSVISNWHYLPLREMTRMKDFQEDPDLIAKKFRFKITPREITKALQVMIELGLLKRDANGTLAVAEGRITTGDDVSDEGIKRYHEQMLDNAKLALRETEVDEREFTASSLVLQTKNLPKAKQLIREFKANFARLLEEDEGDAVYQIQIQLFPLTSSPANSKTDSKKTKQSNTGADHVL
jgi:uncharacterized protein (TIGR02147 family)